jgi:hypothetical protein
MISSKPSFLAQNAVFVRPFTKDSQEIISRSILLYQNTPSSSRTLYLIHDYLIQTDPGTFNETSILHLISNPFFPSRHAHHSSSISLPTTNTKQYFLYSCAILRSKSSTRRKSLSKHFLVTKIRSSSTFHATRLRPIETLHAMNLRIARITAQMRFIHRIPAILPRLNHPQDTQQPRQRLTQLHRK